MELLILTVDDPSRLRFQGDIIAVRPDGAPWGRRESLDVWVAEGNDSRDFPTNVGIIRLPGLSPDLDLMEPATEIPVDGDEDSRRVILWRQFNVWDLLTQPIKNNLTRVNSGYQHNFTANQVNNLIDQLERYDGSLYDRLRTWVNSQRSGNAARPRVLGFNSFASIDRDPRPKELWPLKTKQRVANSLLRSL